MKGKATISGIAGSFDVNVTLSALHKLKDMKPASEFMAAKGKPVLVASILHPVDLFDSLIQRGYKLDLISGGYYQPFNA